ncbi:MAG: hypothetical protein AB7I18_00430 [Candidatus Berkiella sp.]
MLTWLPPLLKTATRFSAIGAKLGGIFATGLGIRQIWYNASDEISWKSKAMLSTLYALHIGSISVATAVLLGATDVSAPVGTALVCSTALLKGIADHFVEKTHHSGLTRKRTNLEKQLSIQNNDFHTTLILIEDLKETDDSIEALLLQLDEYHVLFKQTTRAKNVQTIWDDLKLSQRAALAKNKIITDFFSQVSLDYFDPDSLIKNLFVEASTLRERGTNPARLHEISIIQLQCIKYKRVSSILKEINIRLNGLSIANPSSEREYLLKRKAELEKRLQQLQVGDPLAITEQSISAIDAKNPPQLKKSLIQLIRVKIAELSKQLTAEQLLLIQKKEYLSRPIDFTTLIEQVKNMSATQNQLSIVKQSESTKAKNVDLGAASAVMALILALIPSQEVSRYLHPLMLSIGVLAGIVSLSDLYHRYKITRRMTHHEKAQMHNFIRQKKFQIAKLGDANLRALLINQLDNILQEEGSVQPIVSEELIVNRTRVAKLVAKTKIHEQMLDGNPKKASIKVGARYR